MQRVAVIGVGGMGKIHCNAYSQMPNAELVAVCDILPEVAQEVGTRYGVPSFSKMDALLAEVEVDMIDVCTPTPSHLECIKAAVAAGKHVCSEKPLARTVGQAHEAVMVCEDAGVKLFVAHCLRWFPEFRKIHDLVVEGTVGTPVVVRTSRLGTPIGKWFADFKRSGGVVLDLIIHDFDWLRWTLGRVTKVYARGLVEAGIPGTDYALVTLHFQSGAIAHVEGSWASPSGFESCVEVAGTGGLLSFSSKDSVPLTIELKAKDDAGGRVDGVIIPESPSSTNPYYLELAHFVECLEEGKEPEISAEDGLEAVRIAEAALRSINAHQPVVLA